MLTDVAALSLTLAAIWFASRPATAKKTFGYYRLGGISAGKSYLVWIAAKQYRFVPRVMDLTGDLTGVDFSSEAGRN